MQKSSVLSSTKEASRGQSLVEVALFFPIFVFMLAGLVEISNLLITQNRLTSATRAGTRFAANGGEDEQVANVLLNTVTQTLTLDENVWDVWTVEGTINPEGTDIIEESWEFNHVYGISATVNASEVEENEIQNRILDELRIDEGGVMDDEIAANLKFVATFAIHDVPSILGLSAIPELAGITSVEEMNVMRRIGFGLEVTDGCTGYPLAVNDGVRSVNPPGSPVDPFPNASDFEYPPSPPLYENFISHKPNKGMYDAREGYMYLVDGQEFNFLVWNSYIQATDTVLVNSLTWPGDTFDYTDHGDVGPDIVPGFEHIVRGYIEPGDVTDTELHKEDALRIYSPGASTSALSSALADHVDKRRVLRLVSYDFAGGMHLLANGFPVFRIRGFNLTENWLLLEFIDWDDSCGQNPP